MKKLLFSLGLVVSLLLAIPTSTHAQTAGNVNAQNVLFRPTDSTFTATATKNIACSGQASVIIETKGTFTGMTFNVLGSTDGVNFVALPIVAGLIGGAAPGAAATQPVTAANPAVWSTNVKGLTFIQISNICTACTGSVVYHLTGQSN